MAYSISAKTSGGGGGGPASDVTILNPTTASQIQSAIDSQLDQLILNTTPPTTLAQNWKVQITDGTNAAAVKGPSIAPTAGDASSVVSISPNGNTVNIGAALGSGVIGSNVLRFVAASNSPDVVALGDSADVTIPTTSTDTSTIKGLLRFIANLLHPTVVSLGGFSTTDLSISGKIRLLQVTNDSSSAIYVQAFDKSAALTLGDIPLNGFSLKLSAGSALIMGAADFGVSGTTLSANTRIGLSSTFATYTAITPSNTSIFALRT